MGDEYDEQDVILEAIGLDLAQTRKQLDAARAQVEAEIQNLHVRLGQLDQHRRGLAEKIRKCGLQQDAIVTARSLRQVLKITEEGTHEQSGTPARTETGSAWRRLEAGDPEEAEAPSGPGDDRPMYGG